MFRWYHLAASLFLLQAIGALGIILRLVYGDWAAAHSTKLSQGIEVLMMAVNLMLFWRGVQKTRRIDTGETLAIIIVVFFLVTMVWSVDPEATLRRSVLYLFFVLGVIGMATNLRAEEYIRLLNLMCLLSVAASIVLLVVSPNSAFMPMYSPDASIAFRGIFPHKNMAGQAMVCGVLCSLHEMRADQKGRLFGAFTLLVYLAMATISRSGTSMLTILALCFFSGIIFLLRRRGIFRAIGILLLIISVPVVAIVAVNLDSFFEMIGKDPTLTGRTDIWNDVVVEIYQRPILGWGFQAFWSPANPAAVDIQWAVGWTVPEAHNGLLELLLEIGLAGTLMFVFLLARNVVLGVRCLRTSARELGVTSLLCCGWILLSGISEDVLVDPTLPSVSSFFIAGLMCEKALRRAAHQRRYAAARLRSTRAAWTWASGPRIPPTSHSPHAQAPTRSG
jgi:exopolysaccharide production protein ExoQ